MATTPTLHQQEVLFRAALSTPLLCALWKQRREGEEFPIAKQVEQILMEHFWAQGETFAGLFGEWQDGKIPPLRSTVTEIRDALSL